MTDWFKKTAIIVFCIEAIFFIAPRVFFNLQPGAILVSALGDLTNSERIGENLNPLKSNPLLDEAAQLKADDMVNNGYFSHVSPDGKTPWYWLDQVGYAYDYAGENLAVNFTESEEVTDAWMKSPTHRANIEKKQYTEMGSGIAAGIYKGKEAVFVVQEYANPRIVEDTIVSVAEAPVGEVLGASIETSVPLVTEQEAMKSNFEKDNMKNVILIILISLFSMALILNVFIKFSTRHHVTVTNALLLAVIIFFLVLVNINYLTQNDSTSNNSVDYTKAKSV